jgi:hypothetical protein
MAPITDPLSLEALKALPTTRRFGCPICSDENARAQISLTMKDVKPEREDRKRSETVRSVGLNLCERHGVALFLHLEEVLSDARAGRLPEGVAGE